MSCGCGCTDNVAGAAPCDPCGNVVLPVGPAGANGLSNYELAVQAGFSGTYADWALTQIGPPGSDSVVPCPQVDPFIIVTNGASRWTFLTDDFVQPAVNGFVTIDVLSTAGMPDNGEWFYIQGGGYYVLSQVTSLTTAIMINTGIAQTNAIPTTNVLSTGFVGPSGVTGQGFGAPMAGVPAGAPPGGVIFILNTLTGDVYYWNGISWAIAYNITGPAGPVGPVGPAGAGGAPGADGDPGSQDHYGVVDPNTLAPGFGADTDVYHQTDVTQGNILRDWQRTGPGTWELRCVYGGVGAVQTFRATKTDDQNILTGAAVDQLVNVENDSTGGNNDAGNTWSGSQWTAGAALANGRFTVENFAIERSSGVQAIVFTATIVHRPFGGADAIIGSATLTFTGAGELSIPLLIIASSTINFGVGDTVRLKVTSPTSPVDSFRTSSGAIFYNQAL